jgi:AAA15 family ATPase/GTPase
MLDSIDIKNYRNLKDLRINSLGRVNLITGKNNTGKSTLLEAIGIYATKGDLSFIYQLLGDRGENFRQSEINKNIVEANIKSLSSLFTNREIKFGVADSITIGDVENTLFGDKKSSTKCVSLRFVNYFEEVQRDNQGSLLSRRRVIINENEIDKQLATSKTGIEIKGDSISYILPLDEDRPYNRVSFKGLGNTENLQFIRTRNIEKDINGRLWDNITLTEKEKYVIEALKIIESDTERIAFIEETPRERTTVIKLSQINSVVPLRSMGDGINRILTIILALVNADNGFLLIDEFENGLHHTVQEKLWEIIFNLSQKLKIQVFITTHSEDCIIGFENILNNTNNSFDGKLIRLDNDNGVIKQVEFDAKELKIATDNDIEIR